MVKVFEVTGLCMIPGIARMTVEADSKAKALSIAREEFKRGNHGLIEDASDYGAADDFEPISAEESDL